MKTFVEILLESVDRYEQFKYKAFKEKIEKCTKNDVDRLLKEMSAAFREKLISKKEYKELDGDLNVKLKEWLKK